MLRTRSHRGRGACPGHAVRQALALSIAVLTAGPIRAGGAESPPFLGDRVANPSPRQTPGLDLAPVAPVFPGSSSPGGGDIKSPYADQTPLCHYLERGIDDQKPGKRDLYVLTPPGVETLSDIDHITLGLDLPYTQCDDNPRSHPCTDDDNATSWCVEKIELFVGDKKLYEVADDDCWRTVKAGKDGMRTIDRFDLRNHELWSFEVEELLAFLSYRKPGGGAFDIQPPVVAFSASYLSRAFEGVVGDYVARGNKGCSNGTYCGNRRGWVGTDDDHPPLTSFMRSSKVDCDLGGCASKADRKPSPHVEIRGDGGDQLDLDIDVEIVNSTYDPGDCLGTDCGNIEANMGRGSLELDLDFPCTEKARIQVAGVGTRTYPFCDGDAHSPCWKRTRAQQGSKQGKVECDEEDEDEIESCGQSATLLSTRFAQSIDIAETPTFDAEGGFLFGLLDFGCWLLGPIATAAGCNSDDVATRLLVKEIDTSLFASELFKDLDGCPAVSVAADGAASFDFRELESCPEGTKNPECGDQFKGGLGGQSPQPTPGIVGPGGLVGVGAPPGSVAPGGLVNPAPGATPILAPGGLAVGPGDVAGALLFDVPSGNGAGLTPEAPGGLTAPVDATSARLKPYEIDDLLVNFCAAMSACVDPGFDLAATLGELSPEQLASLATEELDSLDGEIVQLLLADAAFMSDCVGTDSQLDLVKQAALVEWLEQVIANQETCEATAPNVEELYPVPGLTLAITTAENEVTDQYAFVNFRKDDLPGDIPEDVREQHGCAHIDDFYLPPAEIPQCIGGLDEDGDPCGTEVGGPCMEIGDIQPKPEVYEDEAHPNGDWSAVTRCGFDQESGEQMVCVREQFDGAGGGSGGVCRLCGTPGGNSPGDYTMQGCPVELGGDPLECPQDYLEGADGRCWRVDTGPPAWECQADCTEVYGDSGYCFHSGAWRSFWESYDPQVFEAIDAAEDAGNDYSEAICADWIGCEELGASCAAQGKACSYDECATECNVTADCDPNSGFPLRYPAGFVCTPENTCQLP
jgi:hypothetical protein